MSTAARRPPDRYGAQPSAVRRRTTVAALALLAALGVGWVVWAGLGAADREVRFDDVGYDVIDDTTVEVTFSVVKDPDATAVCRLQALNSQHAQVGLTTVELGPATDRAVVRTATIRTSERAVTGIVDRCRVG